MKVEPALRVAAVSGFVAVALGALGAHKLRPALEASGTLAVWQTAVLYHLVHAAASVAAARIAPLAVWVWAAGTAAFSGSLYLLATAEGMRWLGPVTPIGGVLLLAGWAILFAKSTRSGAL